MQCACAPTRRGIGLRTLVGSAVLSLFVAACGVAQDIEPGQTPRPKDTAAPAEIPEEELVKLDRTLEYFRFVEDPGPFIFRGEKPMDARREGAGIQEMKAYEYVLAFAKRQPVERLKKYSVKDVPVENLFRPIRQDYMRELLHVEGKLALILAMKPTDDLKDFGIDQLYEVWVFPRGSNKLFCVVVSELPEGLKPGKHYTEWVAFDAYYFKLFHYESEQKKDGADDSDKKQWQRAPLFLGKTVELIPESAEGSSTYSTGMLTGVLVGLGLLVGTGLVLTLYFRKSDRRVSSLARSKIEDQATFDNIPDSPSPVTRISDL